MVVALVDASELAKGRVIVLQKLIDEHEHLWCLYKVSEKVEVAAFNHGAEVVRVAEEYIIADAEETSD